jgi:LysM repeat protein
VPSADLRASVVAGAAALLGAAFLSTALVACGDDPPAGGAAGGPTLPPIVTTVVVVVTQAPVTTQPTYYEVQRGDTLTEIAVAFGLPVQAIMDTNGMTDPNSLQAGQILTLPSRDIVATALPPTVPGQTAPTLPGETTSTVPGVTTP